jgi:hypothetical protein
VDHRYNSYESKASSYTFFFISFLKKERKRKKRLREQKKKKGQLRQSFNLSNVIEQVGDQQDVFRNLRFLSDWG